MLTSYMCVCMYTTCVSGSCRGHKRLPDPLELEILDSYELLYGLWEQKVQQTLLTHEPFLLPPRDDFNKGAFRSSSLNLWWLCWWNYSSSLGASFTSEHHLGALAKYIKAATRVFLMSSQAEFFPCSICLMRKHLQIYGVISPTCTKSKFGSWTPWTLIPLLLPHSALITELGLAHFPAFLRRPCDYLFPDTMWSRLNTMDSTNYTCWWRGGSFRGWLTAICLPQKSVSRVKYYM